MTTYSAQSIVFIDSRVPDLQDLLDGVQQGELVYVLDPGSDGVQQIADTLAANNFSSLSSISIVSHANTATLDLGSSVITEDTLSAHSNALAEIGASLAPGGIIKLYGCDVAQGAAGQQFINDFSTFAGGAEVDASTNLIGSAALGGSWTLNAASNGASAPSNGPAPFTTTALANFNGTLNEAPDPQIWFAITSPNGIMHVDDKGSTATNATTLYAGNTTFVGPSDVVIDPTDQLYFILDRNTGTTTILEGSLAQALNSPSATPTFSTIFSDTLSTDFVPEIALDTINHQLYLVDIQHFGTASEVNRFERLTYSPTGLTTSAAVTTLGTVGPVASGGVVGFGLDLSLNEAVFAFNKGGFLGASTPSSPTTPASAFLYSATGVSASATSVTIQQMPIGGSTSFAQSLGFFSQNGGLAIDPNSHKLYFTLELGSAATKGGVYEYNLTGNASGSFSVVWQETSSSSPNVPLVALDIDPTTNTYYVATDSVGSLDIWKGNLSSSAAPTAFMTFSSAGPDPQELWLDQEPTLTITASAGATFTESSLNPASSNNPRRRDPT